MTIGERIDIVLKRRGMTRRELAAAVGTTEVSIARYIYGKRTSTSKGPLIAEIAKALNVSADYLLGMESWNETVYIEDILTYIGNEIIDLEVEINWKYPNKCKKLKGELRAYRRMQEKLERLLDED